MYLKSVYNTIQYNTIQYEFNDKTVGLYVLVVVRLRSRINRFYRAMHYVHSAVLRSHVVRLSVRLSVCDVGGL